MKRLLVLALGAISLSACAQQAPADKAAAPGLATAAVPPVVESPTPAAGTADARALAAIKSLNPRIEVESLGPAPLPGFRQAFVAGQVIYVSDDGRYMFLPGPGGALYDARAEQNLTAAAVADMRVKLLATLPQSERIVFAPPDPVHTVTVFTDVECAYCRKLHSQIEDYNAQGIAIEYLAFPRMGIGSEDFDKMVSVWCADDRKQALTRAKSTGEVPEKHCQNTVTIQYNLGKRVGLTGTPMIIAADGTQLGGYLPPAQLRAKLDALAARNAESAAKAAPGDS